jgi:hypothetical protein
MSGVILLLPLYAFIALTEKTLLTHRTLEYSLGKDSNNFKELLQKPFFYIRRSAGTTSHSIVKILRTF